MLNGLAFLHVDDVVAEVQYVTAHVLDCNGLVDLLSYFDATYVNGIVRRMYRQQQRQTIPPLCVRRIPALLQPARWNGHEATVNHGSA